MKNIKNKNKKKKTKAAKGTTKKVVIPTSISKTPTQPIAKAAPKPAPLANKLRYRKGVTKQRRRVRRGARAIPRGFASKRTTNLTSIQRKAQVGTGIRSITQEQIFERLRR